MIIKLLANRPMTINYHVNNLDEIEYDYLYSASFTSLINNISQNNEVSECGNIEKIKRKLKAYLSDKY